jgi:pSer/pThr/pTyr-binding forkhead associated (FHA) protein
MDLKLVMFKPNGTRKDFPLPKPVSVIGRGENCDLQIPLVNASRRHCEISLADGEVKVKDLASSNGTYVNNKRINECPLAAGDRLVIGPVVFTVQIDGVPEEITPTKTKAQRAAEGADEIVDLEADTVDADAAGDIDIDVLAAAAVDDGDEPEDIDPIAALEALAAEGQKKKGS